MKLIDDLCRIIQAGNGENVPEYTLALHREHFIYRSHFPGNPVTPGVCILQLCRELLEMHTGRRLMMREVRNAKFLQTINPEACSAVRIAFTRLSHEDAGYRFATLIYRDEELAAKVSGFCICR
jgi:3-hydroxyacyl-[acyl-carrier-protein] dehydratase